MVNEGVAKKRCSKCGEVKALDGFYFRSRAAGTISPHCKQCVKERAKKWYADNTDRALQNIEAWRREHPDNVRNARRKWDEKNQDRRSAGERRRSRDLTDGYVAGQLRIPLSALPTDLIETKREQIRIVRLLKNLNREIDNQQERSNGN